MQFTAGQQAAIDARNDSVLVSAAAGSGKTAVLVERVLSLLREGGRIDRMLIVTFTRAAAGEMRERIGRRLDEAGSQDAHLRRQALRLPRAAICTLHVFCNRVLREHFQAAEIDPLCRIADEDKLSALKTRALDEVLEAAYGAPTEDERSLFAQFEDGQVTALVLQLYDFLLAQADPWGYAEAQCQRADQLDAWLPLLQELSQDQLAGAQELLSPMEKLLHQGDGPARYASTFDSDKALTDSLLSLSRTGELTGGKSAFARLSTKRAAPEESPEAAEEYKALREEWKKRITAARALLPEDGDKARQDLRHTLPPLRALCALARRLHARYFALKQQKNYLDYSDLEHLTLKALAHPDVRAQVAGHFDALFIDEYQDVSGIQEAILQALHQGQKNLLFMVGDVKQSIYRFRLADPTLFLRKYQVYSLAPDAPCRKILLQQNFRSDANVLQAVNQVFSHAMREKETEIAYDEAAMLRPGGNQPLGAAVEIHLMTAQADEDGEGGELTRGYQYEAAFVAKRIKELMRTATVRDGAGTRPVRFRDIALLLRYASGRAPYIAQVLQRAGIPVYSDADAQFFQLPEVADLLNILRVIDNPLQDVPLLSTLRCPCFGFSEEELARIRLVNRAPGVPFHQAFQALLDRQEPLADKARAAWALLGRWRFLSRNLPVDALVWRVLAESGLYMRAGALEDGELRQANLRLLAERAQGEAAREGLSAFLREMGRLHGSDDGKAAKTLGENEDVVRILTMHKSKGLEFPVVFLLELARPFRKGREESLLRLHAQHGMALKYINAELRVSRDPCAMQALRGVGEKEARAEEARLLYVGMTRARERLILLGSPRRLEQEARKWARPASAYAAGAAGCMLDWVMESLGGVREGQFMAENGSLWQLQLQPAAQLDISAPEQLIAPPPLLSGEADAKVAARLSRENLPQPPLKTSVSAIAKHLREETDEWESPADKRMPPEDAPLPVFLADTRLTAAQRGTVTHRVLGLMDYELVRQGDFRGALDALARRGLLSPAERQAIRLDWLRGFFASELGQRALRAPEVHREWAFNLRGPGETLIQGVIDLCFLENGQWVLVDYKTDRADGETLRQRYSLQLSWYAKALAQITGQPVAQMHLFALRTQEDILL